MRKHPTSLQQKQQLQESPRISKNLQESVERNQSLHRIKRWKMPHLLTLKTTAAGHLLARIVIAGHFRFQDASKQETQEQDKHAGCKKNYRNK